MIGLRGRRPAPSPAQLAEEELSEEDQKLKDDLELMVVRAADADAGVAALAIESLGNEIRCGRLLGMAVECRHDVGPRRQQEQRAAAATLGVRAAATAGGAACALDLRPRAASPPSDSCQPAGMH